MVCCVALKSMRQKMPAFHKLHHLTTELLTVAESTDALWLGARGRLNASKRLQPNNSSFPCGFSSLHWMQTA